MPCAIRNEGRLEVIGREVKALKDGGAVLGLNYYRFTGKRQGL